MQYLALLLLYLWYGVCKILLVHLYTVVFSTKMSHFYLPLTMHDFLTKCMLQWCNFD